jgi:hypothetical protein
VVWLAVVPGRGTEGKDDMTIAKVKRMVAKGMLAVVAAGALMMAAPAQADAQVAVGLRFGYPVPAPVAVPVYPRYDRFAFARREAFLRHEEWVRAHRFDRPYGFYR